MGYPHIINTWISTSYLLSLQPLAHNYLHIHNYPSSEWKSRIGQQGHQVQFLAWVFLLIYIIPYVYDFNIVYYLSRSKPGIKPNTGFSLVTWVNVGNVLMLGCKRGWKHQASAHPCIHDMWICWNMFRSLFSERNMNMNNVIIA